MSQNSSLKTPHLWHIHKFRIFQ